MSDQGGQVTVRVSDDGEGVEIIYDLAGLSYPEIQETFPGLFPSDPAGEAASEDQR